MIRNAVPLAELAHCFVIRSDRNDVDWQHAGAPPVEKVVQAVGSPRDRNNNARMLGGSRQTPGQTKRLSDRRQGCPKGGVVNGEAGTTGTEGNPHEKAAGFKVGILLAVNDKAVMRSQYSSDRSDD